MNDSQRFFINTRAVNYSFPSLTNRASSRRGDRSQKWLQKLQQQPFRSKGHSIFDALFDGAVYPPLFNMTHFHARCLLDSPCTVLMQHQEQCISLSDSLFGCLSVAQQIGFFLRSISLFLSYLDTQHTVQSIFLNITIISYSVILLKIFSKKKK